MIPFVLLLSLGAPAEDWKTYSVEGTNVQVELPKEPSKTSSRSATNAGGKVQVSTAELKLPNALYSVQVSEVEKPIDANTLDAAIRRFAAENKGTVGPLKPITADGRPGREFEMTQPSNQGDVHSKVRWVAAGNNLIMLTAVGKPGVDIPADCDRFLDSLKFGAEKAVAKAKANADANEPMEDKTAADDDKESSKAKAKTTAADTKKATPTRFTLSPLPKNAKPYPSDQIEDLQKSFLDDKRDGFRDVGMQGSVLVGVRELHRPVRRSESALGSADLSRRKQVLRGPRLRRTCSAGVYVCVQARLCGGRDRDAHRADGRRVPDGLHEG